MSLMEKLVSLCKRRGFIFQSCEIYGGLKGVYDFGPLGVELKNNLKQDWWRSMVYERDDVEGLDSSLVGHHHLFVQSGHVGTFNDPLVDCRDCNHRMRADHMVEPGKCDNCKSENLTEVRQFNMMFKMHMGPIADDESIAYLRPETAQHIFANFKNVVDSTSKKVPFGIAQMGKSFRNEIVARNFIFRLREFEQMELEFFCEPGTEDTWHQYWLDARIAWWERQGLSREKIRVIDVPKSELAHYSKRTFDLEYKYPHGFDEIEGIASRSDYDLGNHTKAQDTLAIKSNIKKNTTSTMKLSVRNYQNNTWYIPYVIEPSAGVERGILAVLSEAYNEEECDNGSNRVVLKLPRHLAPIKVAVVPIKKNNPDIIEKSIEIKNSLMKLALGRILFENSSNIGKVYRRHDEVGTPLCVTVDFDSIEKAESPVTIRDRDTMEQVIVNQSELNQYISNYYSHL